MLSCGGVDWNASQCFVHASQSVHEFFSQLIYTPDSDLSMQQHSKLIYSIDFNTWVNHRQELELIN